MPLSASLFSAALFHTEKPTVSPSEIFTMCFTPASLASARRLSSNRPWLGDPGVTRKQFVDTFEGRSDARTVLEIENYGLRTAFLRARCLILAVNACPRGDVL